MSKFEPLKKHKKFFLMGLLGIAFCAVSLPVGTYFSVWVGYLVLVPAFLIIIWLVKYMFTAKR